MEREADLISIKELLRVCKTLRESSEGKIMKEIKLQPALVDEGVKMEIIKKDECRIGQCLLARIR